MEHEANASAASPHQRYSLSFERFDAFVAEYTSLLSLGGMFLKTESLSPVGSTVAFDVKLADGFRLFQGTGDVLWTRAQSAGPGREPGLGVRFQALNEEGRQLILKILEEQVKGGGQPFDVDEVPEDVAQAAAQPVAQVDPSAAAVAASSVPIGDNVMAALGAPLPGGDNDVSEEITMVSQRGLGVGPSQKVDFSTPFGGLSDDMPVGLFDVDPEDGEALPSPSSLPSTTPQIPQAVSSGLENPFAMPEADFGNLDDLPDLDVDDGLMLEPDAEVQFDRTLASATAPPTSPPATAPTLEAPPTFDGGAAEAPSALGVEFETGSEMSLELDDGPSLGTPALQFGAAAEEDDDDEPTMVGSRQGADDLLAAAPAMDAEDMGMGAGGEVSFAAPSSDLDDGTSVSAFDLSDEESASQEASPSFESSGVDVEAPAPTPLSTPGFEPIDTGAPPFDSAALAATEAATIGPTLTNEDGLSTAPWSMPMPAEADGPLPSPDASGDPFATHPPDTLSAPSAAPTSFDAPVDAPQAPFDAPQASLDAPQASLDAPQASFDAPPTSFDALPASPPSFGTPESFDSLGTSPADSPSPHDSTEILEAATALESVGQWEAMDTADVPGAISAPQVPPTAEYDLAAIDASPFGVQDYDLDEPPPPSGLKSKLGGARNLLVSLALVILVGAGYFFRHDLASMVGLGPADGNVPPTFGALGPDSGTETAEDDAYSDDVYGEDAYGDDAYGESTETADADAAGSDSDAAGLDAEIGEPEAVDVAAPVTVASAPPPPVAAPPPPVAAPPARRAAPPPARRSGASATQVLDVQVSPGQGGTRVLIQLDGDLSNGDVIHDPLGYSATKEQIRLLGLGLPYRQNTIRANTSELSQIRIGLHTANNGASELRLVFDMAAEGLSAADYQVQGDRIEILVR